MIPGQSDAVRPASVDDDAPVTRDNAEGRFGFKKNPKAKGFGRKSSPTVGGRLALKSQLRADRGDVNGDR